MLKDFNDDDIVYCQIWYTFILIAEQLAAASTYRPLFTYLSL